MKLIRSIRKLFGIKTFIERHIEQREAINILQQEWNDIKMEQEINSVAYLKYLEWQQDQELIATLDKSCPYWHLRLSIRIDRQVNCCYHVSHEPTAKYLKIKIHEAVNKKFEELKLTTSPH